MQVQRLSDRLADRPLSLEQPTVLQRVGARRLLPGGARCDGCPRGASSPFIAFGLAATGVAVLVGSPCLFRSSWFRMDWMFLGWLKSLLQYAFYQVIAQAFARLRHIPDELRVSASLIDRLLVGGFHLVFLLVALSTAC